MYVLGILRYLVDVDTHGEVDEDGALACVNAALQHTHGVDGARVDALLVGNVSYYVLLARGYHGQHSYLKFLNHIYLLLFFVKGAWIWQDAISSY